MMDQDKELTCDTCGAELTICICEDDSFEQDGADTNPDNEADDDVDSQEEGYEHKVLVSGFPYYTQKQDLERIFSNFGVMRLEYIHKKSAVLSFKNREDAQKVLAAKNVNIYANFLEIVPYNPNMHIQQPPKRKIQKVNPVAFPKSKAKEMIVKPQTLDLSGDFTQQMETVLAAIRLTSDEVVLLSRLYGDVELVVQKMWPGCYALPFGSITTGLGVRSSDADLFVQLPRGVVPSSGCVVRTRRALERESAFTEVWAIPRANTPIVKCFHLPAATACDISFKTPLGVRNSSLLAALLHTSPSTQPAALLLKYAARVRGLTGSGRLNNYALTLLLVFYLQRAGVLPSVRSLQHPSACVSVDGWDAGFDAALLERYRPTVVLQPRDVLGRFFRFYADFRFEEFIVCPYLGEPIRKVQFRSRELLPQEFPLYGRNVQLGACLPLKVSSSLCVQDPFEHCHNVASGVSPKLATDIRAFFKFAAELYDGTRDVPPGRDSFLRDVLVRARPPPPPPALNLHMDLRARALTALPEDGWAGRVRDAVVTVLRDVFMLKVEQQHREPVSCSADRAVWKRRNFDRVYKHTADLSPVQRETKITREVLAVQKQRLDARLALSLHYENEPRRARLEFKLAGGNADASRQLARCLNSHIYQLCVHILNSPPDTTDAPPTPDTADTAPTSDTPPTPDTQVTDKVTDETPPDNPTST